MISDTELISQYFDDRSFLRSGALHMGTTEKSMAEDTPETQML